VALKHCAAQGAIPVATEAAGEEWRGCQAGQAAGAAVAGCPVRQERRAKAALGCQAPAGAAAAAMRWPGCLVQLAAASQAEAGGWSQQAGCPAVGAAVAMRCQGAARSLEQGASRAAAVAAKRREGREDGHPAAAALGGWRGVAKGWAEAATPALG